MMSLRGINAVIASEQCERSDLSRHDRLLRRFAPRNDSYIARNDGKYV